MTRISKDPAREMVVKSAPPALPGMKKKYDANTHTVSYVPKTAREQLREGLRRKPS